MKIVHIGNRKSLRTRCGKPVARRWWVAWGARADANCPECKRRKAK